MDTIRYTSGQIAQLLGIPARTARRYVAEGRIVATQDPITHRWKVTAAAVRAFLHEHGLAGDLGRGSHGAPGGGP